MDVQLKPVKEQVIVITGASSGIGLATARMAAERGARVIVAARNEDALRQFCDQVRSHGGQARYVVVDVASEQDVRRLAGEAVGHFGGFDTWVNNAGVSIYGRSKTCRWTTAALFEINFWGVVYGSRVAVEEPPRDVAVPSSTSAAKCPTSRHSAAGHLLRDETRGQGLHRCAADGAGAAKMHPISVTLIKPVRSTLRIRSMQRICCRTSRRMCRRCTLRRPWPKRYCTRRKISFASSNGRWREGSGDTCADGRRRLRTK